MPDPDVITDFGWRMLNTLPAQLRESPDYQGVVHAYARELERLEGMIATVRAQFNPRTADVLLKLWEALLSLPPEPVGQTLDQRRATVLAMLQRLKSSPEGAQWEDNVNQLIGGGWKYEEHIPGDLTSPPPYTIRITVPFAPSGSLFALLERFLRDITPANLDIILQSEAGFLLDESQLDQEPLHY